jgi:hypothetical protein
MDIYPSLEIEKHSPGNYEPSLGTSKTFTGQRPTFTGCARNIHQETATLHWVGRVYSLGNCQYSPGKSVSSPGNRVNAGKNRENFRSQT